MSAVIRPASDFDIAALVQTLNASYADYPVDIHFNVHQYRQFLRAHDVDLALSVVAEWDGRLAGLAQLARRGERGWVAGLGVKPAARRRGIARMMMEALAANASAAGITQMQLEVLLQNQAAQQLYRDLGWTAQRDLWLWRRPAGTDPGIVPAASLQAMDPTDLLARFFDWHTLPPCWQRQRPTLAALVEVGLLGWANETEGRPVAYALGFPPQMDGISLVDLAFDPQASLPDPAGDLLRALHFKYPGVSAFLSNEPQHSPLNISLAALGYEVVHRQHEMTLSV